MSRRSPRLSKVHYYQSDYIDNGSGRSSLLGSQQAKDSSNSWNGRRKANSIKRPSPTPSLGSSSAARTTYYSESMMSESCHGDGRRISTRSRAALDAPLNSGSYWSEEVSTRQRRGTGGTESSKINGPKERKTNDIYASSSGYSSENDYAGKTYLDQNASGFAFRNALSKAGSFLWLVLTSPGRLLGLLYWWIGTTWYRLTTAASLLDVFVLTRSFPVLKKLLLMLLLLTVVGYGAWYFYPFGLHPSMFILGAEKLSTPFTKKVYEDEDLMALFETQQRVLSRLQALENRFAALVDAVSVPLLHKGASSTGATLPQDEILVLLDGLVKSRETAMREDFRKETDLHLQNELRAFQSRVQKDFDHVLEKVSQTSQDTETRVVEMTSQWQRMLEEQLADLKKEFVTLATDQKTLAKQMESVPGQIKRVQEDVEIQFPSWLSQYLVQSRQDGGGSMFLQREEFQEQFRKLEQDLGITIQMGGITGVTPEQVHHIVNQALKRYSEDRIGMVDYALESAGASVINTRCSETYNPATAMLTLFGIPLWYHSQSPRVILQPDVHPGNCWAFQGPQGFAVVRLASKIHPTAVTLEHIPRSLSPQGTIPSAPKDFEVFGLNEEGQQEGIHLGKFTYEQEGDPIQTFQLQDEDAAFQFVELRVLSNWGHPEYTCIYRFRVHGDMVP